MARKSTITATLLLTFAWAGCGEQNHEGSGEPDQRLALSHNKFSPFVMGSLGDSITAGFNARKPLVNRGLNWSTGFRPSVLESHRQKLRRLMPERRLRSHNYAISGAKAADLEGQVERMQHRRPHDYVTVLIGANDVCDWSPEHGPALARFKEDVSHAFSQIVRSNDDVKILVSAIPDLTHLQRIGKAHGCQRRWELTGFCSRLLGKSVTDRQREAFHRRWEDANRALAAVSQSYPEHVRFVSKAADFAFGWEAVSKIDCFHPNVQGQQLLSDETWKHGWFARD